jgi:copper chaperone CopZ
MSKESAYFIISNFSSKHDVKQIKQVLDTLPGIISVSVNLEKSSVAVDFDNTGVMHSQIENRLNTLGFNITEGKSENHVM